MPVTPEIPTYSVNETVFRENEFRDESKTLYDPSVVEFSYKRPDDTIVPVTTTRISTGLYKVEFEVDMAGRYVYEWLTTGGSSRTGGEFDVMGSLLVEPTSGIVARAVAAIIPMTWDNLMKSPIYGPSQLAFRINATKYRVLGSALAGGDESGFTPLTIDYVSKCVVLDLIPTAIEFWMRQKIAISTTGTNETTSFTDPIPALRDLEKRLMHDVAQLSTNPDIISLNTVRMEAPGLSDNADGTFSTENPYDFPRPFQDL